MAYDTSSVCVSGIDYEEIRKEYPVEVFTKVYTFNSARKSMSTAIPLPNGGFRLFTKGASEIVLSKCTSILKGEGNMSPLTPADHRQIVATVVKPMAGRALRTIALAYRYVYVGGGAGCLKVLCVFGVPTLQGLPFFHGGLG